VLPGARELLSQLAANPILRWTIVTSATSDFARRAIESCSLPFPALGLVTADDVQRGKPHPDPYLSGAERCNANPTACLVVEDATSGLQAACAAGAKTLAVCTSHDRQTIENSGAKPNWIVSDLTRVSVRGENDKVAIVIET
jgi:HAD superfamily hydrolase (TIGR01509 family)